MADSVRPHICYYLTILSVPTILTILNVLTILTILNKMTTLVLLTLYYKQYQCLERRFTVQLLLPSSFLNKFPMAEVPGSPTYSTV